MQPSSYHQLPRPRHEQRALGLPRGDHLEVVALGLLLLVEGLELLLLEDGGEAGGAAHCLGAEEAGDPAAEAQAEAATEEAPAESAE